MLFRSENVQATRETWAKKCDGFVAFSTVDDDSIPAINILHEGVESYNNMWQKSRSIWKYIHAHYSDSFDFFLMGGDDMFYIIENLKHYLMTEEITSYVSSHEGTFLGRRFYPGEIIIKYIFMFFPLVLSYVCVSVLCSTVFKDHCCYHNLIITAELVVSPIRTTNSIFFWKKKH